MSEIEDNNLLTLADEFRAAAFALGISGETVARMAKSPERALACVEETARLGKGPGLAVHMFDAGDWPRAPKGQSMNAHAPVTSCSTCDGDRFVLVALRPAKPGDVSGANFEEWEVCPDCSNADSSFWRADGTRRMQLLPERIREMMKAFR